MLKERDINDKPIETEGKNVFNEDGGSDASRILIDHFNLESYERAIKYLADTKEKMVFTNSGKDHATVIMANIFRTSNISIQIFAGSLKGEVSKGDYITQLKQYLERGNFLTVILEKKPDEISEAIKTIKTFMEGNSQRVKLLVAAPDSLDPLKIDSTYFHFTIGDERMFRFETDTVNFTAVANFNDKETCLKLKKLFDNLEKTAMPLN